MYFFNLRNLLKYKLLASLQNYDRQTAQARGEKFSRKIFDRKIESDKHGYEGMITGKINKNQIRI